MGERTTLPISARRLILSTAAAAVFALGVRLADVPSWTMKDVLAFAALTVGIAVAEQFSIPLRHRTETVNFSLTDALWAAALPFAHSSVLTFAVAAGVLVGHMARRWAPLKIAFNVSQFVVGITLAEIAFHALRPGTPLQPWTWAAVAIGMSAYFLVNANLVVLVVSLVERKRFLTVLLPPLGLNVLHWAGNTALGVLGAILWATNPAGLPLLAFPIVLSYLAYRQWVRTVRERNRMRDLYEAGRALAAPLSAADDFRPFLVVLEQMLEADAVELVVLEDDRITVHGSEGKRSFTSEAGGGGVRSQLEAFVRVHEDLGPQIALIGGQEDANGVLAVYRREPLSPSERSVLETLASQIAVLIQNHRLFAQTFQQAQLAEIVDHTSDGVFVISHDGRILSWNPAMERITGFTHEEVDGRVCEEVLGGSSGGGGELVASFDRTERGEACDSLFVTKDGERRWIRHTGTPIRDREGAPKACVVVAHDVTTEVETEQMKKDFVAMVSHELRSPLTPLKGFLASLLQGTAEDSPEARHEYYRIMLRQADKLERLITDLLDVSQIDSGTLLVDPSPIELTRLVAEQTAEIAAQHPKRSITFIQPDTPILVNADGFRIQQVLANLVSNAVKYSPADAPVEVSAYSVGGEGVVSVRDRGTGIPVSDQNRVFDRFFRVENGSDRRTGGTGLGLYIARQLVEAMSGRLWLVSKPGEGSTFSFSMPRADVVSLVGSDNGGRSVAQTASNRGRGTA
ncbi:MAG TPA: ATP-binding protein [Actinomycetota bacterium]